MYLVMKLVEKVGIDVIGVSHEVDMTFADGMIGAVPVFKHRNDAITYADGKEELVFKIQIK